jgi:cell wall-associated NlpC family hydrolase
MPTVFRSLLLACAFAALAVGCAGAVPLARSAEVAPQAPQGFGRAGAPVERRVIPLASKPVQAKRTRGERAARIALKAVGVPYRWGGSSPATGFDCSGLVYWAYGKLGIALPHSSYALYGLGRHVPRSRMKPGDLIFFSGLGHVGIYLGRGRMVHAPRSGRLVEVVRLGTTHYGSRIAGVRRIVSV